MPALAMPTSAELGRLRRADPGTGALANSALMIFPESRLVPIMKSWGAARIQAWAPSPPIIEPPPIQAARHRPVIRIRGAAGRAGGRLCDDGRDLAADPVDRAAGGADGCVGQLRGCGNGEALGSGRPGRAPDGGCPVCSEGRDVRPGPYVTSRKDSWHYPRSRPGLRLGKGRLPGPAPQGRGPGPRPAEDGRGWQLVPRCGGLGRVGHTGSAGSGDRAPHRPPPPIAS